MSRRARWIRLACTLPAALPVAAAAMAKMQVRDAAPSVLWSSARRDAREHRQSDDASFALAIIAPLHVAPGRRTRWPSWALSPAVAAYRDLGLRAYLSDDAISVQGRRIAASRAEAIEGFAVICASLGMPVKADLLASTDVCNSEFRAWLREGLGLAMTQWGGESDSPSERVFEAGLRARIEAQHDWQFENSWPTALERVALSRTRESPLLREGLSVLSEI